MRVKLVFDSRRNEEYDDVESFSYCGATGEALVKFGSHSEIQVSNVEMIHTYDD